MWMRPLKSTSVLTAFLLMGCHPSEECSKYKRFFQQDLAVAHAEYRRMPIEAQIDIHLCSFHQHPTGGYVVDLAHSGKPAAYAIVERLQNEAKDRRKVHLLDALDMIDQMSWRIGSDPELLEAIERQVSVIRRTDDREEAMEYLRKIQHRSVSTIKHEMQIDEDAK